MHEPTRFERFLIGLRGFIGLLRSPATKVDPDPTISQASPAQPVDEPEPDNDDGNDDSWCYGITNANKQYLADPAEDKP
jgi:hypothetical protein